VSAHRIESNQIKSNINRSLSLKHSLHSPSQPQRSTVLPQTPLISQLQIANNTSSYTLPTNTQKTQPKREKKEIKQKN
jgi:hypothetical protein